MSFLGTVLLIAGKDLCSEVRARTGGLTVVLFERNEDEPGDFALALGRPA